MIVAAVGCALLLVRSAANEPAVGTGVLLGVVLLLVSFAGLVLVFQSLGLADSRAAFGLPRGSIRALLALGLVVMFIAVASWELINPVDPDQSDLAKQILTISASALTTVIGFYFGSNASNDAAHAMQQALQANQPAQQDGTQPPDMQQLTQKTASVRAMADAAKAKLAQQGDPSLETIAQQLAAKGAATPPELDQARNALQRMQASANACDADAARAEAALKDAQSAASDATKLAAFADRIEQAAKEAAAATHDLAVAQADFAKARDALLGAVAQG